MTDVERAVADAIAVGMLDPQASASDVADLAIYHARSLAGIEAYQGIETLSLVGCALGDYSALARLGALRVLIIENCDLRDVRWAVALPLQVAVLRRNRLRDALTIVGLPTLQSLDLTGNPLDVQTRSAAEALAPGRLVMLDDEEVDGLNRSLAEAATGIVVYRTAAQLWACATGLDLTATPEAGHVSTSPDEVQAVVQGTLSPRRLLQLGDSNE